MASNGPYYQSVQPDQIMSDELKLAQGLLDYGAMAPQASMYPDPNQPQLSTEYHTQQLVDNDAEDHAQLQGLVEAATSAAAQEQIRQRAQMPVYAPNPGDGHAQHDATDEELATLLGDPSRLPTKRKRSLSPNSAADPSLTAPTAASERPKRQKRPTMGAPEMPGQEGDQAYHNSITSPHHLDARAAGVHSAAALFRPPSDSSKKYTRPPMSKLFASLELSPEHFLYLQAAAKQFMLDPDHPERQACIGNRGKGDSDLVKLKLHYCVHEFLSRGGWADKYFGENAPLPDEVDNPTGGRRRKYVWPRDQDRIIALCTPLLRRMVTNERQRQYAVESRKGGKQDKPNDSNPEQDANANTENHSAEPSLPDTSYDPRLAQAPACQVYMLNAATKELTRDRIDYSSHEDISWHLLLNELPRFWCETLQINTPDQIQNMITNFFDTFHVKVLTSAGLTSVANEGAWALACHDASQAVWLEGVVKVIVECGTV